MDDRPNLYDDDIVTWAEEQAAALRDLPSTCPVPPEALLTGPFDLDGVLRMIAETVER